MKYHVIDNSLKNLGKVVLWQYDSATRLLSLLKHMQVLFHCAIERFWQYWLNRVLAINTCGEFGCSVWSLLLGIPRPIIKQPDGTERSIVTSVYRLVLKARYYLSQAVPSNQSILQYLEILFGVPGEDSLSKWTEEVSEYGWYTNVDELNEEKRTVQEYHVYRAYDEGEVFEFAPTAGETKTWKVVRPIKADENVSWEVMSHYVEEAPDTEADYSSGNEMILLKLYDPNHICRKITGAPRSSLEVRLEYVMGTTTIVATVTRRRKCGVALVDNGSMSLEYVRSPYFYEMHKDQQALFDQWRGEFCPKPLGIGTNEPKEEVVFGFNRQENAKYVQNAAYSKGDVFGYIDADGHAFNWKCKEDISANENTSFDAISDRLEKTNEGDPFIGNMVDVGKAYGNVAQTYMFGYILYDDFNAEKPDEVALPPDKWPALADILTDERYVEVPWNNNSDILCTVPACGCVVLQNNALFKGRIDNLTYLFKIPDRSTYKAWYLSKEVFTDGETYIARFVRDGLMGNGLQIITPLMPPVWGMPLGYADREDPLEKFGVTDALGKIAKLLKWTPISATEAEKPISGCSYIEDAVFTIDGSACYKDGKRIPQTSLISNSTLSRIKQ